MSRYAVIGYPVSHSKSPRIHRLFAQQTNQDIEYTAITVLPEKLAWFVKGFFADGGAGLNITLPFKQDVYRIVTVKTPRAELAQAANTLYLNRSGELCGDVTDGVGLVTDLQSNLGISLIDKHILILGAGGAVRGILAALIDEKPASITIANRTVEKALALQLQFQSRMKIDAVEYQGLRGNNFDLIINGTSMGLKGEIPPIEKHVIGPHCCCYDMVYSNTPTPFVSWARENGAKNAVDGTGMLVEQAAESFLIWRGVKPETRSVIQQLKAESGRA